MNTVELAQITTAAGFEGANEELQAQWKLFALLLLNSRTAELISMFQQWHQQEINQLAQQCGAAGQAAAAEQLMRYLSNTTVTADAVMVRQLL